MDEWNNLLRTAGHYADAKEAKAMKLTKSEVVALKLYTDFDILQREYRKSFRKEDDQERLRDQSHFVHWNALLVSACKKAEDVSNEPLFHGVGALTRTSTFNGKYWGPVSTSTVFNVANQFSGKIGIVLQLEPMYGAKGMRLKWLSNYPDEDEVLYMNTTFNVVDILDSQTSYLCFHPLCHDHDLSILFLNMYREVQVGAADDADQFCPAALTLTY